MKHSTINDCRIIDLRKIHDPRGNLTPIEGGTDVPFDIKRVYYLYDVPGGESRGAHAHKELQQLIVAASGSFTVTLDDGKNKKSFISIAPTMVYWLCLAFGVTWMTFLPAPYCYALRVSIMMRRIILGIIKNF